MVIVQFCPILKVSHCHYDLKTVHSSRMRCYRKRDTYYGKLKKCAFQIIKVVFWTDHITIDPKDVAFMVEWQRQTAITEI